MNKSSKSDNHPVSFKVDVQALFDKALAASLARQSETAVVLLNEILARNPYHANARHLLGAEYAQAGNIAAAVLEIASALEINPNLPLARFQLGLLLLTSAKVDDAVLVWQGLDNLGSAHVLNRFRHCMLLITQGHGVEARKQLAAAIADNIDLPELNNEMLIVIDSIATADSHHAIGADEDSSEQHFLVSTYVQSPSMH